MYRIPDINQPSNQSGLYDRSFDRDACGVGFIVNMHGRKSHDIVLSGAEILVNLTHRGACGCDPHTGDGAGMLTQIPHDFFTAVCAEQDITLPAPGDYGIGFLFLPSKQEERAFCEQTLETLIAEEGQTLLGWRDVPVEEQSIGWIAREVMPVMRQVFLQRGQSTPPELFEWKLYVLRKRFEQVVRQSGLSQAKYCYTPSMSSRVIVYKGLMLAEQVTMFYPDLKDERFDSALALVHQRYSTNTFPTWDLAQPFRYLAHNGEINTLRGNFNWMRARESMFENDTLKEDLAKVLPVCTPGASDSATFDNVLELLLMTGRPLQQVLTMMIPEPWEHHEQMSEEKKAYYEYQACLMEPWDGPASMAVTDGTAVAAVLDRNGLRPSRYWVTKSGNVIMASEAGVLEVPSNEVDFKGRLQPGRMLMVDTSQGRIVSDQEIKVGLAKRHPYREWLRENQRTLADLPDAQGGNTLGQKNGYSTNGQSAAETKLTRLQRTFGYTLEDLRIILDPMASNGAEPIGSMGTDTPLAVLSSRPQLLYNYFQQLFAQVTNPPLDAIREAIVTSLITYLGSEGNLLRETPEQCRLLRLETPILSDQDLARIRTLDEPGFKTRTLSIHYPKDSGDLGLEQRLEELFQEVSQAIEDGVTILILSDRNVTAEQVPIPALLATAGIHHHLSRNGTRTRCSLVVESGEPRENHHFALLTGYGADAINPYVAFATITQMKREEMLAHGELSIEDLQKNYIKAINKGLLKIMSKMGISTIQSYRGAQIFEAVGLSQKLIDKYFTWTPSRLEGIGLETIDRESRMRHSHGFPSNEIPQVLDLDVGGQYQWRRKGEVHLFNPAVVSKLQQSSKENSREIFQEFCQLIDNQHKQLYTLRGLLELKPSANPIPLEEVEPAKEIVKRFSSGAMSYGSISKEAHETLAIAMNRIGGKSNTGEGGEDPARFIPDPNGDSRRSATKQVASGRFGVTSEYLVNSDEIQIKMAQGAKPGEGGQLPGHKVNKEIARVRHSTPWVGLISPPPHHDIYSIEDLAQLIHDLKNANHHARINVKLVAAMGVGTVAAGVAKGKADAVMISGHDGGTGASPQTSIKHAGLPWELGVAETHQVLLENDLRSRIVVQTDGQVRTARDVAIATLLGAEEYGIATAALVVAGCIMMRKCHLNTCPVGIATQDPELRKKFHGSPDHVVNYYFLLAEELRVIMAQLGCRTINEMVGRTDLLDARKAVDHWKASGIDVSCLLHRPEVPQTFGMYCSQAQDHELEKGLDMQVLLDKCQPALDHREPVKLELPIKNINRTVGTILSSELTRRQGAQGLPEDTIDITFHGTTGQSVLAFGTPGITFRIFGDVNDYCGKGLCGAKLIVRPPRDSSFLAEENIICGNVALYGATGGELYVNGIAGERFCVRNSGASAVVEGIGDHGCEYMTGGRAVILGPTGRNFAAGMSGGIAYVLDEAGRFPPLVNQEMVELESLEEQEDIDTVLRLIHRHVEYTDSARGRYVLDNWEQLKDKFVKVMPIDYKRALEELRKEQEAQPQASQLEGVTNG